MTILPDIIDIEASAFGKGGYPIEIGYVLGNGDTFCSLILPAKEWNKWDTSAEQIHGVTREALLQAGQPIDDIAHLLNQKLKDRTLYSDAWGNDSSWLAQLFDEANLPIRFKLESIRYLLTETQAENWHEIKDEVIKETDVKRHRASSDAIILQKTYEIAQARYQND
ncbi:MAG: hypothetical protein ACPHLK_00525 [Gammaproteobacteria bacterium]|jgi:hypothetical protein